MHHAEDDRNERGTRRTLWQNLDERLGLGAVQYPVPPHANTLGNSLGGITLICFLILVATGFLLAQYYNPLPEAANESTRYIITTAPLGRLVRGVHYWAAQALVLAVSLHLIRVFVTAAYKRPREANWLIGVGLLIGGLGILSTSVGPLLEVGPVLLAVALTLVGILIAFGPWVTRLARDLGAERRERIRQEERAELAAHLHDSVLQTLALIQRTDDPARMSILARHQEGELREWLYGNAPLDGADLVSTALKGAATRIESDHQIPIDVVTVGDHPVDECSRALVSAASEALVNGAKHSGSDRLSLYFEAEEDQLSVFVTDHGKGFDASAVPKDRRGITQSIMARVERAGGKVEINSEPGEGTEVILRMPVRTE